MKRTSALLHPEKRGRPAYGTAVETKEGTAAVLSDGAFAAEQTQHQLAQQIGGDHPESDHQHGAQLP